MAKLPIRGSCVSLRRCDVVGMDFTSAVYVLVLALQHLVSVPFSHHLRVARVGRQLARPAPHRRRSNPA
jgi:hypothetical protein